MISLDRRRSAGPVDAMLHPRVDRVSDQTSEAKRGQMRVGLAQGASEHNSASDDGANPSPIPFNTVTPG
jgi:hypothetical protein